MENPGKEIGDVVRALVKRPTFKQQAEAIEKYFTPDCTFFHVYVNTARGHSSLTALYQYGMFVANYQDVIIRSVVYDPKSNCVGIRMTVICKPWLLLWRSVNLEIFTHCELEDSKDAKVNYASIHDSYRTATSVTVVWMSDEELMILLCMHIFEKPANLKVMKKVKSQKDYFIRDPLIQLIPVVGPIYDSDGVKFVMGEVLTQAFRTVQSAYFMLVPEKVQGLVFSFWEKFLLVPPTEQFKSLKLQIEKGPSL